MWVLGGGIPGETALCILPSDFGESGWCWWHPEESDSGAWGEVGYTPRLDLCDQEIGLLCSQAWRQQLRPSVGTSVWQSSGWWAVHQELPRLRGQWLCPRGPVPETLNVRCQSTQECSKSGHSKGFTRVPPWAPLGLQGTCVPAGVCAYVPIFLAHLSPQGLRICSNFFGAYVPIF